MPKYHEIKEGESGMRVENKAYLVPFSHLDLFWLGEQDECLSRGNRIIWKAIELAEKHDEFCFLIEDLVFVDYFVKSHPEKVPNLKALLRRGRIEIGPKWAGIRQNLQCGEDLVRNTLYAVQYAKEVFGFRPRAIHLGDLPGWTPQYPQIAKKSGLDFIVLTRCGPADNSLFYWKGLDGSEALVWYSYFGYAWTVGKLEDSVARAKEMGLDKELEQIIATCPGPIFVHWGIDLIVPPERLIQNIAHWNEHEKITFEFATPMRYFEKAKRTKNLPRLPGEVPSAWPFTEAEWPDLIPLDALANHRLMAAEKFATIADVLGYRSYPSAEIRQAWLKLLEAMDHNYAGTGSEDTYRRKKKYRQYAIDAAEEILGASTRSIAENVKIKGGKFSIPLVVFNPLSWTRSDIAVAHACFYGEVNPFDYSDYKEYRIVDERGRDVPFQELEKKDVITREVRVAFTAERIPSVGYATYYLVPAEGKSDFGETCRSHRNASADGPAKAKPCSTFSNDWYELKVDETTGSFSIRDRRLNRWIMKGVRVIGREESAKCDHFEYRYTGRIFQVRVDNLELVENAPVRAVIQMNGTLQRSSFQQQIILYGRLDRIDLINTLHWKEDTPVRVQQLFPLEIDRPVIRHGVPYGSNLLSNVVPNCQTRHKDELSMDSWLKQRECQQWLYIGGSDFGVTIASDHRQFEFEGSEVRADMVRATAGKQDKRMRDSFWRPPYRECTYVYSVRSHGADLRKARSWRDGWQLVNPLITQSVSDPISTKSLPSRLSFCQLTGASAINTVLKKAEADDGIVLRLFETAGTRTKARVKFFKEVGLAQEVDLLEKGRKRTTLEHLTLASFEIKTLKLSLSS